MQKIFNDMLHQHVEYYVNDMVVKSKKRQAHLDDLHKVFDRLCHYQVMVNPLKCTFNILSSKFPRFIV